MTNSDAKRTVPLPSGGRLHIVAKEDAGKTHLEEGDVLVVDDRWVGNPSFQIAASHRIKSRRRKLEILDAIIAFDRAAPTDPPWQRSRDSLLKEWNLHNLAYRLHVYRRSARDVDLDNRDEGKGYLHFFFTAVARVLEKLKLKRPPKGIQN